MVTAWAFAASVGGGGIAVRTADARLVLHVAPDGQDAGSGRAYDRFATIYLARDEVPSPSLETP